MSKSRKLVERGVGRREDEKKERERKLNERTQRQRKRSN